MDVHIYQRTPDGQKARLGVRPGAKRTDQQATVETNMIATSAARYVSMPRLIVVVAEPGRRAATLNRGPGYRGCALILRWGWNRLAFGARTRTALSLCRVQCRNRTTAKPELSVRGSSGLFQVGTKMIRIGCVESAAHGSSRKPFGTSVGCASASPPKKAIASSIAASKRGERDSDHDALATATRIARRSLCHVRTVLHQRFGAPAKCVYAAFRLGGNHDASQFGLPCLG